MNEIRLADRSQRLLDEANHAYRELRILLDRAALVSQRETWKEFFRDQALLARNQRQLLQDLVLRWGRKLRPCTGEEIDRHLNEARFVMTSKEHRPQFEMTVYGVMIELRVLIIQRLEAAAELAVSIEASVLAAGLQRLLQVERDQQRSQQEVFEQHRA